MAGLSSQVLHIWDVDEQICEIFGIWAVIRCWFMVTIVAIIQRWPQIWIQFSRIWWSNETGSTCQWFHVISCPNICVYIYRVVYRLYIYMYMYSCICLFDFIWILWTWVIYYNFENYDDPWELGLLNHSWSQVFITRLTVSYVIICIHIQYDYSWNNSYSIVIRSFVPMVDSSY